MVTTDTEINKHCIERENDKEDIEGQSRVTNLITIQCITFKTVIASSKIVKITKELRKWSSS